MSISSDISQFLFYTKDVIQLVTMIFLWFGLRKVLWRQIQVIATGLGDGDHLALSLDIGRPRTLVAISELEMVEDFDSILGS